MAVDLHIHSTASDGTLTPLEIAEKAQKAGLNAFALTDHDSVAGLDDAAAAGGRLHLEVVPGLELSSRHHGKDIHILGYFIDRKSSLLLNTLAELRKSRQVRAETMVERLASLGLPIAFAEVQECAGDGAVGRPHIAQVLLKNGAVDSIKEAFELYIGDGGPAYIAKRVLSTFEVIDLIRAAAGIASLAHPGVSGVDEETIREFKKAGLDAVEVWHTDHDEGQIEKYIEYAEKMNLLITGGSDCHGAGKGRNYAIGAVDVPDSVLVDLRAAVARRRAS